MRPSSTRIVEMRGITKRFGGVTALDSVDFDIYPREIHGLCGDNAAGKSTLIKILSGALMPTEGEIRIDSQPVKFNNPRDAKDAGIETVYQDLALADNLDVASNIFLGRELVHSSWRRPFLKLRRMQEQARDLLARLKIHLPNPRLTVRNLSGGQRQCVAIARSVYFNARIILLDEPTAALGVKETRKVFDLVTEMREQGLTVVMISHNLNHVFDLCDRITVLKTGQLAGTRHITETNKEEILRLIMTGGMTAENGSENADRPALRRVSG